MFVCLVAVLSSCVAHENIPLNCSSQAELWERLSADLSASY